jgi:hypothetical protein
MTFVDGGGLLTTPGANLHGLADLAGKRIAVIPGTTTEKALADFLKAEFITVEIVRVKDLLEGLGAVDKGLAEAFASDRSILMGLAITSRDPTRFALANVIFSYEPYGLMMRRNDGAFRLAVNRALAGLYRSRDIRSMSVGSVRSASRAPRFRPCIYSTDCRSSAGGLVGMKVRLCRVVLSNVAERWNLVPPRPRRGIEGRLTMTMLRGDDIPAALCPSSV